MTPRSPCSANSSREGRKPRRGRAIPSNSSVGPIPVVCRGTWPCSRGGERWWRAPELCNLSPVSAPPTFVPDPPRPRRDRLPLRGKDNEELVGKEIEHKFLVRGDQWRVGARGLAYRQGYLAADADRTVRVRVGGDRGYLTVKGKTQGIERTEFEYEIPLADAEEMLDHLCLRPLIEKVRYRVEHHGRVWEVDDFSGENRGLVVAEIEVRTGEDRLELPDWVGPEVSGDPRYYNANLVRHPYSRWQEGDRLEPLRSKPRARKS